MSDIGTVSAPPTLDLIYDDGEPLESHWHRIEMNLFIGVLRQAMVERGTTNYFAGGNMFIYYSPEQAHAVATLPLAKTRHYRGPDVFFVSGTEGDRDLKSWVVWNEHGRYPDFILELLSRSSSVTNSSADNGRLNRKPCIASQWFSIRNDICFSVSTPSAITFMPRLWPSEITALIMAAAFSP